MYRVAHRFKIVKMVVMLAAKLRLTQQEHERCARRVNRPIDAQLSVPPPTFTSVAFWRVARTTAVRAVASWSMRM
jgi:hypothetical protein